MERILVIILDLKFIRSNMPESHWKKGGCYGKLSINYFKCIRSFNVCGVIDFFAVTEIEFLHYRDHNALTIVLLIEHGAVPPLITHDLPVPLRLHIYAFGFVSRAFLAFGQILLEVVYCLVLNCILALPVGENFNFEPWLAVL